MRRLRLRTLVSHLISRLKEGGTAAAGSEAEDTAACCARTQLISVANAGSSAAAPSGRRCRQHAMWGQQMLAAQQPAACRCRASASMKQQSLAAQARGAAAGIAISSSASGQQRPSLRARPRPCQPPAAAAGSSSSSWCCAMQLPASCSSSSSSSSSSMLLPQMQQQLGAHRASLLRVRARSSGSSGQQGGGGLFGSVRQQAPDPWTPPPGGAGLASGSSSNGRRPPPPMPPPSSYAQQPNGGGGGPSSFDPWATGNGSGAAVSNGERSEYERTDWGWDPDGEDWDPADGLGPEQLAELEREYSEALERRRAAEDPPRDKWITPLLDWQSISGAFDPDQSRYEDAMADEALTNKEESRDALAFSGRLVVVPLITGALISRAITGPVLSFSLQNNPNAFAMSERQKIEGAAAVHLEETRVQMMVAIGQAPPLDDGEMLRHLHEYAHEVQEEERHKNEAGLMTLVSDSISAMVFGVMLARDNDGRAALLNTIGRLFEGLSDIAKAVLIILVADTLLGYHSEEGWTGFIDVFLGHYGIEVEEESIVLFVGIIPIAIDVVFKYWIFIGLNKISPGAVVTIKQLDRH